MTRDEIEDLLRRIPVPELPPERETRLFGAVRDAGRSAASIGWWRRPVPVWQAVAACLALIGIDRAWIQHSPDSTVAAREAPAAIAIRVMEPIYVQANRLPGRFEVANWKLVSDHPQ